MKAKLMWAHEFSKAFPEEFTVRLKKEKGDVYHPRPVLVLPLDDVEALVERVAAAIWRDVEPYVLNEWSAHFPCGEWRRRCINRARIALKAAGIPAHHLTARKKR